MKRISTIFLAAVLSAAALSAAPANQSLQSPDGRLSISVSTGDGIFYTMSHDGTVLIENSPISMTLSDGTVYGGEARLQKAVKTSVDRTIDAAVYKKAAVEDKYNELTLKFKTFSLVFRAYDSGMAYRFISHAGKPFEVVSEQAVFSLPEDWNMFVPYVRKSDTFEKQFFNSFENTYRHTPVSEWEKGRLAFLPLMIEASQGKKLCITEADLLNYPGMYLFNDDASTVLKGVFAPYPKEIEQGGHNMLQGVVKSRESYIARFDGAVEFPWRIVAVSSSDKEMADNDLVYCLASPASPDSDFSWVRPGKVAWDWWNDWNLYGVDFRAGINNETYKYYIDFASEHGIEYVILDEGWAVNLEADLMQVIPEIDLEELAAYAEERNVGLILWAGYWAFNRDMEGVCRHYSEMGIKGFKIDFMDRDDQMMVDFHRKAAETAAKYHLMVDFHGTYKPTGLHRTYPNVINFEGVHGLEQMKWSGKDVDQVVYDVTIPFIRQFAGPMDYTQGAMRNATKRNYNPVNTEAMSQGTRCRQLAEYVVFISPLNMLCDSPSNYMNEPECTEYIAEIPVVWDETVALDGKVGEYIAIARRSGDTWYVGAMTDWSAREMQLDLSFLPEGKYMMEIYKDGINADRAARDYKKEILPLPDARKVDVRMAPGGGFAAKIIPVK